MFLFLSFRFWRNALAVVFEGSSRAIDLSPRKPVSTSIVPRVWVAFLWPLVLLSTYLFAFAAYGVLSNTATASSRYEVSRVGSARTQVTGEPTSASRLPTWPHQPTPTNDRGPMPIPLSRDHRKIGAFRRPRRKGSRDRAEIARNRQQHWDRTAQEVDELVAEHHAVMPRSRSTSIGAAYARYSTRFQDSIADQVRAILHEATKLQIHVPRDLVFFDMAVSGVKKKRVGLDELKTALKAKKAQVLLLFSTSRLFRKTYRTLAFVDQVHKGLGMRCIFIKSGVDTDDKHRWEMMLSAQAMIDQFVVSVHVENIRAAHEGLLEKRLVFGTLSYGYQGEPLVGETTARGKTRCKIVLDDETVPVVQRIFRWYVDDSLWITEIIRLLNDDPNVPLPPRCASGEWTRLSVRGILKNSRYRGLWRYGVTEAIYQPEGDYTRQLARSEPLKEAMIEEFRIVSDELWYAAQDRLIRDRGDRGRKAKDGDKQSRPKLLNGLFWCHEHQRALYVNGWYGKFFACPSCQRMPAKKRPLFSQLNRQLAMELTCQRVAELLRTDSGLVAQIMDACVRELERCQQPDPSRESQLRAREEKLTKGIEFGLRNPGDNEEDERHTRQLLAQLRAERTSVQFELQQLSAAKKRAVRLPTRDDIMKLLKEFDQILVRASTQGSIEEMALARSLIERITGGRVTLYQQGERKPHKGWLQGRFQVQLLNLLVERLTGASMGPVSEGEEVVIDFRRPDPAEEESETAWSLYEAGKMNAEIAVNLGCSRARVAKLIKRAADKRGESVEDGRTRRSKLAKKHLDPPMYQQIADRAVELWDESDLLIDEIASELRVDRNTITHAVAYWHKSRGLSVPDGRTRRKRLSQKSSPSRKRKS